MTLKTKLGCVSVMPTGQWKEGATVPCQGCIGAYAPVHHNNRVSVVALIIQVTPDEAANHPQVFVVRENQFPQEMEHEHLIGIPIKWDGDIPKTRERGKDNVDVIILMEDGRFVDVQCGIITRRGSFYMTAQRVYEGQVVRTRGDNGKVVSEFVPTSSVHAYPGASYAGVWSTLAEAVMSRATDSDASAPKSRAKIADVVRYKLPETIKGGWMGGWVDYFNLITGTGQIEGRDGVKYFVHFNNIVQGGKDPVPMLIPKAGVLFRPAKENGHIRPGIKSVQAVKPIEY